MSDYVSYNGRYLYVFPEVMAEFKLTNRQIINDDDLFREVVLSNAACAIAKFIIAKAKKL